MTSTTLSPHAKVKIGLPYISIRRQEITDVANRQQSYAPGWHNWRLVFSSYSYLIQRVILTYFLGLALSWVTRVLYGRPAYQQMLLLQPLPQLTFQRMSPLVCSGDRSSANLLE